MNRSDRVKTVFVFLLKFSLFAPVCLVLWWLAVPSYIWLLGRVCGFILVHAVDFPLEAMAVTAEGVLNTRTFLVYVTPDGDVKSEIGRLVNNVPPYVILVLATPGLGVLRRMKILGIGTGILMTVHFLFLLASFTLIQRINESQEVGVAVGKFLLTLPFVLWIVLAYWDKLVALMTVESEGAERPPTAEG